MSQCRACGNRLTPTAVKVAFGVWHFDSDTGLLNTNRSKVGHAKVSSENTGKEQIEQQHQSLVRKTQQYPLAACHHCALVQMDTEYSDDLIKTLYFHSTQESVLWHESLVGSKQPYHEAAHWVLANLPDNTQAKKICDFGCANGDLLHAFATELLAESEVDRSSNSADSSDETDRISIPHLTGDSSDVMLIGADFNDRCASESIDYYSRDLNNLTHIAQILVETQPDVICLSHTLEHVLDPLGVCRSIADNMHDESVLFIEVPDFSEALPSHLAGRSNLVNMQHVQYFSLASLTMLLQEAGLAILQSQQIITGYIPRLQVLVQRVKSISAQDKMIAQNDDIESQISTTIAPNTTSKPQKNTVDTIALNLQVIADDIIATNPQKITDDIVAVVQDNLTVSRTLREHLLSKISEHIAKQKRIYLWGIGADFYALSQLDGAVAVLQSEWVVLVDYELAGKYWQGKKISSSTDLPSSQSSQNSESNEDYVIYLVPVLAETRYKMQNVADANEINVRDCFAENLLAIPETEKMSCQVCQNQQFVYIDTLHSGVWQKREQEPEQEPEQVQEQAQEPEHKQEPKDASCVAEKDKANTLSNSAIHTAGHSVTHSTHHLAKKALSDSAKKAPSDSVTSHSATKVLSDSVTSHSATKALSNSVTSPSTQSAIQFLKRNELSFAIEQCQVCQHVQITTPYSSERFTQLYFSDTAEPNMWPVLQNQPSPYAQMVELLLPYLKPGQHVADFGCGAGALLLEVAKTVPQLRLTGVDFIHHQQQADYRALTCDLNDTAGLHKIGKQIFDVIMSSHVLEHVLAPVAYLRALRRCLKDDGVCLIEVPDASFLDVSLQGHSLHEDTVHNNLDKYSGKPSDKSLDRHSSEHDIDYAMTNLVHGQHIHYFSRQSLINIVRFAGFEVIKTRDLLTGDIPRLQIVLKKAPPADYLPQISHLNDTAYPVVKLRFTQYQDKLDRQYQHIMSLLKESEHIGLWGIGGDVYRLFSAHAELVELVGNGRIVLFDHSHQGLLWQGSLIKDSAELTDFQHPVVLGPFYVPTISSMQTVARKLGVENSITSCFI